MNHHQDDERQGSPALEPDILLGSQYFDRVRRRAGQEGERQLMVAVLEDAVHTYLRYAGISDPAQRELFREAEEWIESADKSDFYSFENVCAILDLDAGYIRGGLRARKEHARDQTAEAEFRHASGA